jgi:hypothetical protein
VRILSFVILPWVSCTLDTTDLFIVSTGASLVSILLAAALIGILDNTIKADKDKIKNFLILKTLPNIILLNYTTNRKKSNIF